MKSANIPPVLSRSFTVKPSESNAKRELPLPLLISQIIDLATDHANIIGIGYIKLQPMGAGWVLSRVSVEMKRWPSTGDNYKISTWIESWNRHFSERCFSVETEDGEIIGYVRTIWVIIELNTHKSLGTAGLEINADLIPGIECKIDKFSRHKTFEPDKVSEYTFQFTDLDYYRHVNTVRYINLLLNQFSLEEMDSFHIHRCDIAFQNEAKYGEKVLIKSLEERQTDSTSLAEEWLKRTFELRIGEKPILTASIVLAPIH